MKILYLNKTLLIIKDMLNHIRQPQCELSFSKNIEHALDICTHEDTLAAAISQITMQPFHSFDLNTHESKSEFSKKNTRSLY